MNFASNKMTLKQNLTNTDKTDRLVIGWTETDKHRLKKKKKKAMKIHFMDFFSLIKCVSVCNYGRSISCYYIYTFSLNDDQRASNQLKSLFYLSTKVSPKHPETSCVLIALVREHGGVREWFSQFNRIENRWSVVFVD